MNEMYNTKLEINEELRNAYPWGSHVNWKKRTQLFGGMINRMCEGKPVTVIDLGGGFGNLFHQLQMPEFEYISIDRQPYTNKTIVADFNKGEFPKIDSMKHEPIIAVQGLLEYIADPKKFLKKISQYGKNLVISYRVGTPNPERKNYYSFNDVARRLIKAGWLVTAELTVHNKNREPLEKIYLCLQINDETRPS